MLFDKNTCSYQKPKIIWDTYKLTNMLNLIEFQAVKYLKISNLLTNLKEDVGEILEKHPKSTVKFQNYQETLELLNKIQTRCSEIDLNHSVDQAIRIKTKVELSEYSILELFSALSELHSRMQDEMSARIFLYLPHSREQYFNKPNLFGEEVFNRFPKAIFEIEEAGNCLALGRWTACVMHLQRTMEVGLKGYGRYLGVVLNNPNWNTILNDAQSEINRRNTSRSWRNSVEKDFCEQTQPLIHSVRVAWRNPSMHSEKTYDEGHAKVIFEAVRGFMRNLAKHLNEKGKFRKKKN